jgi:dipeptidyl aminopeptidase/acylaminoacyl peptidase
VGDIDGPVTRKLFDADSAAVYTSGYLLFVRQATLFAHAFDEARLETTGNPLAVADDVRGSFLAGLSAARGLVAFRAGPTGTGRQFIWLDRTGKEIARVADPDSEKLSPSVSPDGGQLAFFGRVEGTNTDIWLLETQRGRLTRFTDRAADDIAPVWSRDGSRIAYSSNQGGRWGVYLKSTTGAGPDELLINGAEAFVMASDWSPGDRTLLYQRGEDIWSLPMAGSERKPSPVIQTEFDEREGLFSPNGRWMAYVSNRSGSFEVYVQPFPAGPPVPVSTRGGAQVRWRADGRELFYVALDGTLMAVPIEMSANGLTLTPGTPVPLFPTHIGRVINAAGTGPNYIASADGQQFLMSIIAQETSATPIRLFVNWKPQQ